MFLVISLMALGIVVGYLFRRVEILQSIPKTISYTIFLLLFLLGVSVGNNDTIINNLPTLGGQALLIASAASLGSAIAAWLVYKLFFNDSKRIDNKKEVSNER